MKIPALDSTSLQPLNQPAEQKSGARFAEVRAEMAQQTSSVGNIFGGDSFDQLRAFQQAVLSGKRMSPEQLLVFQVKATDAHMRVELLSKIAESAISTAKRLQNPQ
jgi:hypothetical protein